MIKINNFAHMKKITTFVILFALFLVACETEFEVNADWKEVTVVYGLLDQSNDQQYIKINKAYLGIGDALQMASVADSINYNPADLEVKIIKVKGGPFGSIDTVGTIYLDTTLIAKDDGLFATDEHIIYTTSIADKNFFRGNDADEKDYILSVFNKRSGNKVSSKTSLVNGFSVDNSVDLRKMNFYDPVLNGMGPFPDPPYDKENTTVEWRNTSLNKYIYQIRARVYYRNYYTDGSNTLEYIDWQHPTDDYGDIGNSKMIYELKGDAFVNLISTKMPEKEGAIDYRLLAFMELQDTVCSEDLETYMILNDPFEGIVQERPTFSNINNGVGLFSSRYTEIEIWDFSKATQKGLKSEFGDLGFEYFE
jgi:hypothetical protein